MLSYDTFCLNFRPTHIYIHTEQKHKLLVSPLAVWIGALFYVRTHICCCFCFWLVLRCKLLHSLSGVRSLDCICMTMHGCSKSTHPFLQCESLCGSSGTEGVPSLSI